MSSAELNQRSDVGFVNQSTTSNDNSNNIGRHRIYPVTEGIQSTHTADVYKRYFNHFLDYIKIHDLQVLLDFSPKVIKQMLGNRN
jgi:hypothetical protein